MTSGSSKAAQHVQDGVDLADGAQELVAEPLALGRAAHQPRDVLDLELRRDDLRGLGDARQHASRGSGTGTRPTLGSIVQNG